MISVREAVRRAFEFVADVYNGEGFQAPQLEEVELSEDQSKWLITLSFLRLQSMSDATKELTETGLVPPHYEREYKLVTLDADTGGVFSMKIRQLV